MLFRSKADVLSLPGKYSSADEDKQDKTSSLTPSQQTPAGDKIYPTKASISDVEPAQKLNGDRVKPVDNGMKREFDALREDVGKAFPTADNQSKPTIPTSTERTDNSTVMQNAAMNTQNRDNQWHNAAFSRAMERTRLAESGDSLNNHFSGGNTNY